jgi:hypothetical protein
MSINNFHGGDGKLVQEAGADPGGERVEVEVWGVDDGEGKAVGG